MSEIIRSEQIGDLAAALAKAKLNYGVVVRTKENTYTHSKYAELQDLMDAIQKPLAAEGLSFVHFPIEQLSEKRAGARTLLIHSTGQYIGNELLLPAVGKATGGVEKLDAQTIGAAITYAKRYNVQGLGDVVGESEDDGDSIADKSSDVPAPPKPKTVTAPPVNKTPAKTGGERPQEKSVVPKAVIPQEPVKPPAVQQPAAQPSVLPFDAVTPDQNAQFHPADNKADTKPVQTESKPVKSTSSQTEQAVIQPDTSEKPVKSQLDTYISKIRDDIRPALEKAGLKASKNFAVGAKLKNYLLSAFGNPGAKELTDLTIKQWDAFFAAFQATDAASFALKVEEANKK